MLVTALFLAAAIPSELIVVETGSPDSLCPSLDQATRAIHARTGMIKSEQSGWLARYTLGHSPSSGEGDFIRLQLYDPLRRLRLSRDVPVGGASCNTMAQTIAIVVGTFFTSLLDATADGTADGTANGTSLASAVDESAEPSASTLAAPGAKNVVRSQNDAPTTPAGATIPALPSSSSESPSVEHHLGVGLLVPFTSTSHAVAIGHALGLRRRHEFGIHLALPIEKRRQQVGDGNVDMRSFRTRLWYGASIHPRPFSFGLGPSLVLGLDVAQGNGLDESFKQERFVVAVGSIAAATLWVHGWLGVRLQGGVELTSRALCRRFLVESNLPESRQEVHAPSWWNGFVGLTLEISRHG